MSDGEQTREMVRIGDTFRSFEELELFRVICEGLDLAAKLWPKPQSATVTLETHEWIRLRRVLLALPDMWEEIRK